ncbi:hypothetical protein, partial [Mycobacterium tuberculosis]
MPACQAGRLPTGVARTAHFKVTGTRSSQIRRALGSLGRPQVLKDSQLRSRGVRGAGERPASGRG